MPSDLHGAFTAVVPDVPSTASGARRREPTETTQSKFICNDYLNNQSKWDGPSAFDVFSNWEKWKTFLNDQITGKSAPQPARLRNILRYSFIPIAYFEEDYSIIRRTLRFLDAFGQDHIKDLIVVKGIAEYLEISRKHKLIAPGDFDKIKRSFSHISNSKEAEVALLTRYAMGLCLMSEAFHSEHDEMMRRRLRNYASDHFKEAHSMLELDYDFKTSGVQRFIYDSESKMLLKSYICAHLARLSAFNFDLEQAGQYFKSSLECRDWLQQRFDMNHGSFISKIFRIETLIHKIRQAQVIGQLSVEYVNEIEAEYNGIGITVPHQSLILRQEIERVKREEKTSLKC